MTRRIAIDFGTTRTKVAYSPAEGRPPELLRFGEDHRPYRPSLFYLPKDGGPPLLFEAAEAMLEVDPAGVIDIPKRRRRSGTIRAANGRTEPLSGLLASLFADLRAMAGQQVASFLGVAPDTVVLTVPVGFGPADRDLWHAAATAAGFTDITLVDEPVAAARAWLAATHGVADSVVVLDCGGGTVDWAWLKIEGGVPRVAAEAPPGGIYDLGGHDVDVGLLELLETKLAQADGESEGVPNARRPQVLARLRRIKEAVARGSESGPFTVDVARPGRSPVSIPLSQAEVEAEIQSRFVAGAVASFQHYLSQVRNANGGSVPPTVLVGGSGRLSGLRTAVENLGVGVVGWDQADFAPVLGGISKPAALRRPLVIVDKNGGGDASTLADAIKLVQEGGRIEVRKGHHEVEAPLVLSTPMTIVGIGNVADIVITGKQKGESYCAPIFEVSADEVHLKNLGIIGQAEDAIVVEGGCVRVQDCRISTNKFNAVSVWSGARAILDRNQISFSGEDGSRPVGVHVSEGGRAEVADNTFTAVGTLSADGIVTDSESNVNVNENKFEGLYRAICVSGTASIKKNRISRSKDASIDVFDTAKVSIEDNDIGENDEKGERDDWVYINDDGIASSDVDGIGVRARGTSDLVIIRNNFFNIKFIALHASNLINPSISDNKFKNIGNAAIYCYFCERIVVKENRIERCFLGFGGDHVESAVLRDNKFNDIGKTAIFISMWGQSGSDSSVYTNEIEGCGESGIVAKGSGSGIRIANNKISNVGMCFIQVEGNGEHKFVVEDNILERSADIGIIASHNKISVIGNKISNTHGIGMVCDRMGYSEVMRNIFSSCSSTIQVKSHALNFEFRVIDNFELVAGRKSPLEDYKSYP